MTEVKKEIYHIGNLARDRLRTKEGKPTQKALNISAKADEAMSLFEKGMVFLLQKKLPIKPGKEFSEFEYWMIHRKPTNV